MQFCSRCGSKRLVQLASGGCGGRGSVHGCEGCDAVFVQNDGGFGGGGNVFSYEEGESLKEQRYRRSLQTKVFQNHHPERADTPWGWAETGGYVYHFFSTQEEAEDWLKVYQQSLLDALPYPNCDKCGKKGEKRSRSHFRCLTCHRHCFTSGVADYNGKWLSKEELGWSEDY